MERINNEGNNWTDDISQFELSITAVNFEMTGMRTTMDRTIETFSHMNTENRNRDRHIAEVSNTDQDGQSNS